MSAYRSKPPGPPVLVVAFGDGVRGLDARTGKVIWEHEPCRGRWTLQVTRTAVYAANGEVLVCLDYLSGAVRWSVPIVRCLCPTLLLEADCLYVGAEGEVACISLDGKRLWHNELTGKGTASVSLGCPGNVAQAELDT